MKRKADEVEAKLLREEQIALAREVPPILRFAYLYTKASITLIGAYLHMYVSTHVHRRVGISPTRTCIVKDLRTKNKNMRACVRALDTTRSSPQEAKSGPSSDAELPRFCQR